MVLDRYIARAVISGCLIACFIMLSIFAFVDFIAQLNHVGTGDYGALQAAIFVLLRLPQRLYELAPSILLLGGILSLGAMAANSEGFANLQRVMWGYARNPNCAGVLMVGLGCESNQIDFLLEAYGIERSPLFRTMNIQDMGGLRRTVAAGVKIIGEMLSHANELSRQTCDASHLTLALQCGGSDAWSGVTANPALGYAADLLVRNGGTGRPTFRYSSSSR